MRTNIYNDEDDDDDDDEYRYNSVQGNTIEATVDCRSRPRSRIHSFAKRKHGRSVVIDAYVLSTVHTQHPWP